MTQLTLAVLDTTGIQNYIFNSNRLRENVGASHLVHLTTRGWLLNTPDDFLPPRHNLAGGQRRDDAGRIEEGTLDAELVYSGGGNVVLLFAGPAHARQFATQLSARLLCDAPGLEAVLVTEPFDWQTPLKQVMAQAMDKLEAKKAERERSQSLLGLGVTAACRSTGLVGSVVRQEPGEAADHKLILSAEVSAKWDQNDAAKERLAKDLSGALPQDFQFPDQFEHLGRTAGQSSYIAVVHADGNSVGEALQAVAERFPQGGDGSRAYIQALRAFSDQVNGAGLAAFQHLVKCVAEWNRANIPPPAKIGEETYLSLRPLVYGGDDVTFVCEGRIGLAAAQTYLAAFNRQALPDGKGGTAPGLAGAGVAIVKVGYPFARAYELAETLCKNAKNTFQRQVPALDWHLAQSGLFGDLHEIRRREYDQERNGDQIAHSLLMRPLAIVDHETAGWHTWENWLTLLKAFQDRERWPRNKVMLLRETLREKESAVRDFVTNYGKLPDLGLPDQGARETGWSGGRCIYFDAIEMIDQEVPQ